MHNKPKESDWKVFRAMAPELRERYLHARNNELASILSNDQLSETERFWASEERSREIAKVLRACLDGHSRSKMAFFMVLMLTHGMMTQNDLAKFSDELQERMSWHIH